MPEYRYIARRYTDGKSVKGRYVARDRKELNAWLTENSLYPIQIDDESREERPFRVDPGSLAVFCQELASLLDAGMPLLSVLNSLASHSHGTPMSAMVQAMVRSIEGGLSFSETWVRHCATFADIAPAIIAAGESSGNLPEMLRSLGNYLEESVKFRAWVMGLIWYPVVLVTVATAVTVVFIFVVLPKFAMLLGSMDVRLPLLTRCVLAGAHLVVAAWPLEVLMLIAFIAFVLFVRSNFQARRALHRFVLKVPLLGYLVNLNCTYIFAHTSGLLLESGLTITDVFRIVARTLPNIAVRERLFAASEAMASGSTVSEAIVSQNLFSPMAVEMISAGEKSGRLTEMLRHVARYSNDALSRDVKRLSAILEPAIIVPVAGFVTLIIASMLLPYFKLIESIR